AKVSLRLGVPNFPGDTMTLSGEVTAVEDSTLTVTVVGKNTRGAHVTAQERIAPNQEHRR
ncbi:MAG: hypothetical protein ACRDQB_17775, partial [Thermocrispum sp.]